MIGLTPHFYKDGVEVFASKGLFSIVSGGGITPGSYDQISFDIFATNQDVPIQNIKVENAYPQAFLNNLSSAMPQTLAPQESKPLWTSGLMNAKDFEAISPVNFWIEISGYSTYTEETVYPDRVYSGDITFETEDPPPIITIAVPEQGLEYFSPITFEIYINEIAETQISIDGGSKITMDYQGGASETPPNLKFIYTATLSGGAHSVTFYAMDAGGNTVEKSVGFEICTPHLTYSCYGGDVYWYDSCGNREDKKEECGTLTCIGGVCVFSSIYQETANTYAFTDDWLGGSYCAFDWNKFKDGSWTTYLSTATKGGACSGQATMIYSKPTGATSAVWKVKDEYGTRNLNIPSSCWSASSTDLTLRYRSYYSTLSNYLLWECYNGGTFTVLWTSPSRPGYPEAYEEAVTWN